VSLATHSARAAGSVASPLVALAPSRPVSATATPLSLNSSRSTTPPPARRSRNYSAPASSIAGLPAFTAAPTKPAISAASSMSAASASQAAPYGRVPTGM
jgi:hypothetical protein